MFHTVYKFDIMSEQDIEREIESVRRREAFFSLLVNQPSYYESRKFQIEEQLERLRNELDAIYDNETHKEIRRDEARETIRTLYEALSKKQAERMEREKLARQEATKKKAAESNEPKKRKKKLTFEEKLTMLPESMKKGFTVEQLKELFGD